MKKTLLIPCAGRSTRYPGTRPKWLLTTPNGQLMIERAAHAVDSDAVGRIVIGTLREYEALYGVSEIIKRTSLKDAEIVFLDEETSGPAETVRLMIEKANVTGPICLKDSDSFFELDHLPDGSFITLLDLRQNHQITSVGAKSFGLLNEQGLISDIVEKSVVSNFISVGLYGFSDAKVFTDIYDDLRHRFTGGEFFYLARYLGSDQHGRIILPCQCDWFSRCGYFARLASV